MILTVPLILVVATTTTAVVAGTTVATTTTQLLKMGTQAHGTAAHSLDRLQETADILQLQAQISIHLGIGHLLTGLHPFAHFQINLGPLSDLIRIPLRPKLLLVFLDPNRPIIFVLDQLYL